jgi:alpha-beta hydrolase superfamily lysophospholipase
VTDVPAQAAPAGADILGAPYTVETIELPDDYEGRVVTTLVRRPAEAADPVGAVLHVHGFCDYFFQTAEADLFTRLGYQFYALDLRKHGRSLLPHQTPNFCLDLAEYHADLDAALARVLADGHRRVVVSAHSTGGLIAALWAHARRAESGPVADAFVLNSPWLDLQGSFLLRTAGTEAVNRLGARRPYATVPRNVSPVYAHTLHRSFKGEWDYDLTWKPVESFPVKAGWLRAVRQGHRTVHRGIDVGAPVLTLCSTVSLVPKEWSEDAARADTVLDVRQIAKWSHALGRHVTVVRVPDALHDVLASPQPVRTEAFGQVERWLDYVTGQAPN